MHHTRSTRPPEFIEFAEPKRVLHKKQRVRAEIGEQPPVRRTVADYSKPTAAGARSSITRPVPEANNRKIPSHLITVITHSAQFHGLQDEDPNSNQNRFVRICDTFPINGMTEDITWADMQEKFLNIPRSKTVRLRSFIHDFKKDEGESLYEMGERFKELLHSCPHHMLEDWALVEKFFDGASHATKHMLDTTTGGNLMTNRTPEECMNLFEELDMSSYHYPSSRSTSSSAQSGVH
ncbi:hypothetical protein L1987_13458 [Smallanthus sonchifolius]|uniref:Uncharacterized protein n=1 Tax=Smallanthus sonchifolius TaxID=185202 RepID=A0ACB9JHL8_9ASTR|nr:hypothetical protein L1987_13458 [Smallanthus sonchifolius]